MAEIQNAGKAGARSYVGKAEDAKKLPGADTGAGDIKEGAIAKDEFKFKKILWTPEDRARFRLNQAESQIDRNLESIDKAIAERSQGGSWMKHFSDPALGELRRARAELLKAKKDVAAAKQALDGSFPMWKIAQAHLSPDIWRKPQPDLAEAEARLNSALGRLAKAEHCVQSAIDQGPDDVIYKNAKGEPGEAGEAVEGKGGLGEKATAKCPGLWHPTSRNTDLRRLLNDIRETGRGLETAREDLWEAQEKQQPRPWPPIHVDPPIWREPPIHRDPPIRKFPPIQIDPPIRRFPPGEKLPPIEKLPIDRFPGPDDTLYVKGGEPEDSQI